MRSKSLPHRRFPPPGERALRRRHPPRPDGSAGDWAKSTLDNFLGKTAFLARLLSLASQRAPPG